MGHQPKFYPTLRDELRKAAQQNSQRPDAEKRRMSVLSARLAFASYWRAPQSSHTD